MGWKKPGKMLLAQPPAPDECAHRMRFRPNVTVEVRRGGWSHTLIAGFLGSKGEGSPAEGTICPVLHAV
jgi:hypothetical protein